MNFYTMINRILGHEGGYVNDPNDPGGETKWGISKRSYPSLNIKMLSKADAIEIYHRDFYLPVQLEGQPPSVVYQLLDFAVNSGIRNTIRCYQRVLGVAPDGFFGPHSLEASRHMSEPDKLMRIIAERLRFMASLKNWKFHGKGWANRMADNLDYAASDTPD